MDEMRLITDKIFHNIRTNRIYRIRDLDDIGYVWLIAGDWRGSGLEFSIINSDWISEAHPNREGFIEWLSVNYPKDLQLILFHPEILDGNYYD